jgi:hypothetical protein
MIRQLVIIVARLSNKTWGQRSFLFESLVCLLLSQLIIYLLPFRRLTRFLNHPITSRELGANEREEIHKNVSWAINRVADHLPMKIVCFPRGIAAYYMLRKRGIPATLYYGVASPPEEGLKAHVWVQDGTVGLVGHHVAGEYRVLFQCPETR